MLTLRDALMLAVSFSSILAGIFLPETASLFQPYPIYCMMALIFFSFLSVRQKAILATVKASLPSVCYYLSIKLILLPAAIFVFFQYTFPDYALAALLLSGVSTGVASPFFAGLVEADMPLMFSMVVTSSILVPFTLPALVKVLAARNMEISLLAMMRLLCLVVFVPLFLAEALKRVAPAFAEKLSRGQYPVSLVSFAITNLGVFSQYSGFLREEPFALALALGISVGLAGVFFVAGILSTLKKPLACQLSVIISFGILNNILVLVFSAQFFGHREPTVAAIYTIPFFGLIVPLRLYRKWKSSRA